MAKSKQLNLFDDMAAPAPAPQHNTSVHGMLPTTPTATLPNKAAHTGAPVTERPQALAPGLRWREVATPVQPIGFMLRRSRRRTIGLTINDDGLLVAAPSWVTLDQIDSVVREKHEWILRKLTVRRERQVQLATADTQWQHGGQVPYLGQRILLHLDSSQTHTQFSGSVFEPAQGDRLTLPLPADADTLRVRDGAHAWLQQQAKTWFEQRTRCFLERESLQIKQLRLSAASTRWGSCSSDGKIMLNWRLIHFGPDVIDYVIAHEIAHLREMNHSPAFWREVGRILPGFEQARDALRHHRPGTLPLL